ncbi:hypothetical protein [uncultured Amnibacterium sp.]|uniref:hypothetical protein n=1 Tax=uncultured Amnibacterium sp. TaxID=1631851 RepID=UPI0035CBE11E
MSRVAPQPDRATRLRRARGTLILGLLLCLPRAVLVWFVSPALDLLQVVTTLVFVGGLLVIAIAIFQLRALRTEAVWPIGLIGVASVAIAAVAVLLVPPGTAPFAYGGSLIAPPAAAAYQYGYLLLGAMSQLGLMLIVGAVGLAITHRRSRRTG